MKFLANENFPSESVTALRQAGLDIVSVGEENSSISDEAVMTTAITEKRTILTFDKDYGELVFSRGYKPTAGIVFLRLRNFSPREPAQIILQLLNSSELTLENYFTVIDREGIRQRKI